MYEKNFADEEFEKDREYEDESLKSDQTTEIYKRKEKTKGKRD